MLQKNWDGVGLLWLILEHSFLRGYRMCVSLICVLKYLISFYPKQRSLKYMSLVRLKTKILMVIKQFPGSFKIIRNLTTMSTLIVKERTFLSETLVLFYYQLESTHFRIKGLIKDRNYFIVR